MPQNLELSSPCHCCLRLARFKNKNTVKVLIGIIPSEAMVFVSPAYEGSISDKKLVQVSGLLEKLEVGDDIMYTRFTGSNRGEITYSSILKFKQPVFI